MSELKLALEELYEEFGKEKVYEVILLRLSQILDKYIVLEQRKKYEEMRRNNG